RLPAISMTRGAGTCASTSRTAAASTLSQSRRARSPARQATGAVASASAKSVRKTWSRLTRREPGHEAAGSRDVADVRFAVQGGEMGFLVARLGVHQRDVHERDDQHG